MKISRSSSTFDPENGFIHISTNSMVMRSHYTESEDIDVLVLGDQMTFAPRNFGEKTFPALLDTLLGKDVRVANAAGIDVGWEDYPTMLSRALAVWNPKTIIIASSFDDYMPARRGLQYTNQAPFTGLRSVGHLLDWLSNIQNAWEEYFREKKLKHLTYNWYQDISENLPQREAEPNYATNSASACAPAWKNTRTINNSEIVPFEELVLTNITNFGAMWSEIPWRRAEAALGEIRQLTDKKRMKVVLTFIPHAQSLLYGANYPTRQTLKMAQKLGWTGLDMAQALLPDLLCNYYTPEILSSAGHKTIARALAQQLRHSRQTGTKVTSESRG